MKSLTTAVLLLAPFAAFAGTITDVVVFGDSLSDNGNVYAASRGTNPPSPPYYEGRYSNGPVAVEDLAKALNLPLFDYAFGGATTGIGDEGDGGSVTTLGAGLPGMTTQYGEYATAAVKPNPTTSLFVVWGGPDDLLAPAPADAGNPVAIANTAAANIINIVHGLESMGAAEILVPGVTDLALVPDYASETGAATAFALSFDDLIAGLPAGATYVDTYFLLQNIVNNHSAYGFTNATTPCLTGLTPCANPNQYLFWDGQHPTAAAQQLLADDLLQAVPEPKTGALTMSVLALLGFGRWRSRRRTAQPSSL